MERVARHMQVVAGLAAVGALAGCLVLAGCGSAPEASSPQPTQAQPAASQQPTAAKQDAKPSDTAKASDDSTLGSESSSSDSSGRSDLQLGEFQARTLKGGSFTQEDIAAKDVTVLNMWSTTCGPCVNEMPEIAAFAAALPENVQVVTYCFDGLVNEARADRVLQNADFQGTTLITADGGLKDVLNLVQYTPTTIFVSKDGTVVGDALVGVPEDLQKTYLERVNDVLDSLGERGITLEEAK